MDSIRHYMAIAKQASTFSNCNRRKIGAVIEHNGIYAIGSNGTKSKCKCCTRETGDCPAIHAEVDAALKLPQGISGTLYVWSEVPCVQCINFIATYTDIKTIHCLTINTYAKEYPRVLKYGPSVIARLKLAKQHNISVIRHRTDYLLEESL